MNKIDLFQTQLALQLIQTSCERCYRATGSKCMVIFLSKSMAENMDPDVLSVFGSCSIVDPNLPGFTCYTRTPHQV